MVFTPVCMWVVVAFHKENKEVFSGRLKALIKHLESKICFLYPVKMEELKLPALKYSVFGWETATSL